MSVSLENLEPGHTDTQTYGHTDIQMKVLIVEDEQKVQNFLKKGLTEKGFAADGASDLDENDGVIV